MLRKIFSPILNYFEAGDAPYVYKASHRRILFAVGALFLFLALAVAGIGWNIKSGGAVLPSIVFFAAALVCLVVSTLGSDRAVARIWHRQ